MVIIAHRGGFMKSVVVINEQHSLLPDQIRALSENYADGYELQKVPSDGLTLSQQDTLAQELVNSKYDDIVFASPIPALIILCSRYDTAGREWVRIRVLHNDKRVAKEIDTPQGKKIIHTVAPDGWQIV